MLLFYIENRSSTVQVGNKRTGSLTIDGRSGMTEENLKQGCAEGSCCLIIICVFFYFKTIENIVIIKSVLVKFFSLVLLLIRVVMDFLLLMAVQVSRRPDQHYHVYAVLLSIYISCRGFHLLWTLRLHYCYAYAHAAMLLYVTLRLRLCSLVYVNVNFELNLERALVPTDSFAPTSFHSSWSTLFPGVSIG